MDLNPFNPLKLLCWRDEIDQIIDGKIPYPVAVEIDPSNQCTSNCIWCMFNDYRRKHAESLDASLMFKIIEELAELNVKAITFTGGGEPLANLATPEAMVLAKNLGIQVGLVTNGDLLGKKEVKEAVLESCRYIRVSLDAGTNETHYSLKHPKFRDQLSRNLSVMKTLIDCGFKGDVGAAFLIHPKTYCDLPALLEKLESIHATYLQIRPCIGASFTIDMINYTKDVVENYWGKLKIYANFRRFDEIKYGMSFSKCRATPLLAIIGANAKLYLCCQFRGNREYVIGDLKKASFKEQWGGDVHRAVIDNIELSKCPPCRYSQFNKLIEEVFLKDVMHKNFV